VLEKHWPNVRRHDDVTTFLADAEGQRVISGQRSGEGLGGRGVQATNGAGGKDSRRRQDIRHDANDGSNWAVDLICGGFPCQPVSVAGKQQGDADARWLWPHMRRVCEVVRPRWVLAENVPGLLSASSGRLFGEVVRDLAALGYVVEWFCMSAANVGANHIRDRVWILAHADRCEQGRGQQQEWRQDRGDTDIAGNGEAGDVAHAEGESCDDRNGSGGEAGRLPLGGCGRLDDVAHAQCRRLPGGRAEPAHENNGPGSEAAAWWATEPDVGRVASGVPKRVDRLRALGNAVVPQVAEAIGRMILND